MSRSRYCFPPKQPTPAPAKLLRLQSSEPHAFGIREGHSGDLNHPTSGLRPDYRGPGNGRPASSLRAARRLNSPLQLNQLPQSADFNLGCMFGVPPSSVKQNSRQHVHAPFWRSASEPCAFPLSCHSLSSAKSGAARITENDSHSLVDTLGLPIASRVEPANTSDRRAAARLLLTSALYSREYGLSSLMRAMKAASSRANFCESTAGCYGS